MGRSETGVLGPAWGPHLDSPESDKGSAGSLVAIKVHVMTLLV